jgi:VIT1/CCC1 family predicted Fe2+/Mn2+ transporter
MTHSDAEPAKPDTTATMIEHTHSDISGGWLRAAVFGAMDGLVTNISLIAGVGGGGGGASVIILSGVAGLVAGAISMGMGEYTSVQTSNEQVGHELDKERHELEHNPHAEQLELADMLRERGLSSALADQIAEEVSKDPELALRIHAEQELGVVIDELPKPWTAAISSFVCFSVGALVPLLPFLFGFTTLWLALAVGGLGLFGAGAVVSRFTARPWWANGGRQLLLGGLAAGATYLVGTLIGVSVS